MARIRILQDAAQEAEAAAAWYERGRQGLGTEFLQAIEAGLDVIAEGFLPLSRMPGASGNQGAKRLILRRFPYDIVVIDRGDERLIVAFAHHSRKPGYWRNRASP